MNKAQYKYRSSRADFVIAHSLVFAIKQRINYLLLIMPTAWKHFIDMIIGAREQFRSLLDPKMHAPWISELAGILPLSALIDFVDAPKALHILQLGGEVPLWCWSVTPSASRMLLNSDPDAAECCLDVAKRSDKPFCLDGRYGDKYPMANAETVRMCLEASRCHTIDDDRQSKFVASEADRRPQQLEFIVIRPAPSRTQIEGQSSFSKDPVENGYTRWLFRLYVTTGWVLWACLIACCILLGCWLALAFLIVTVLTGLNVHKIYGGQPRRLGSRDKSGYNRLIISADHENEYNWRAFYGRSDLVSSLLNWPLVADKMTPNRWLLRILRALVLAQWSLAIGAAALKGWDAYFISFWILLCIVSISYVFATKRDAKEWMINNAKVQTERYKVQLSSRRALLNTLIALNPDTFGSVDQNSDRTFQDGSLLWLDSILKQGEERTSWEKASRRAMNCEMNTPSFDQVDKDYQNPETHYWWIYVKEGVRMAAKIGDTAGISGHNTVVESSTS
jgi:hypothetical protein